MTKHASTRRSRPAELLPSLPRGPHPEAQPKRLVYMLYIQVSYTWLHAWLCGVVLQLPWCSSAHNTPCSSFFVFLGLRTASNIQEFWAPIEADHYTQFSLTPWQFSCRFLKNPLAVFSGGIWIRRAGYGLIDLCFVFGIDR